MARRRAPPRLRCPTSPPDDDKSIAVYSVTNMISPYRPIVCAIQCLRPSEIDIVLRRMIYCSGHWSYCINGNSDHILISMTHQQIWQLQGIIDTQKIWILQEIIDTPTNLAIAGKHIVNSSIEVGFKALRMTRMISSENIEIKTKSHEEKSMDLFHITKNTYMGRRCPSYKLLLRPGERTL